MKMLLAVALIPSLADGTSNTVIFDLATRSVQLSVKVGAPSSAEVFQN